MIRVFHAIASEDTVDRFDRAMHARGVFTLSHHVGGRLLGDPFVWLADVHPIETAIVLGHGDTGAALACDLAADLNLHVRPNVGVIAVDVPTLTHPLWGLLPAAKRPRLPAGVQGVVVTDPHGPAAYRGNLRAAPAAWAHRVVVMGLTDAHVYDAIAEAIRRVDKARPVIAERVKITERRAKPLALRILPPLDTAEVG